MELARYIYFLIYELRQRQIVIVCSRSRITTLIHI